MSEKRIDLLRRAETELAYQDDLTGLFNYRLLADLFEEGWDELVEEGRLALVILDLDLFKDVNDTYGHLTGNLVLRETAEVLRQQFRQDDVLVRYGGDEFVVICPGATAAIAERLAERARRAMTEHEFLDRDSGEPLQTELSFSVGLASYPEDGRDGEKVLRAADARLFEEKEGKRRARLRSSPLRGRLLLPALGILVLVLLALLNAVLERIGNEPLTFQHAPSTVRLVEVATRASSREAELLEELGELRSQIRELTARELPDEAPPWTEDRLSEVSELEARIADLERELAEEAAAADQEPPPQNSRSEERASPAVAETPQLPPERAAIEKAPPEVVEERASPELVPPRLVDFRPPAYPAMARRMKREAIVELRLLVDEEGVVLEARPLGDPVGFGFEEAARRAALAARYAPGRRDGVAVAAATTLAVEFRLQREP